MNVVMNDLFCTMNKLRFSNILMKAQPQVVDVVNSVNQCSNKANFVAESSDAKKS